MIIKNHELFKANELSQSTLNEIIAMRVQTILTNVYSSIIEETNCFIEKKIKPIEKMIERGTEIKNFDKYRKEISDMSLLSEKINILISERKKVLSI